MGFTQEIKVRSCKKKQKKPQKWVSQNITVFTMYYGEYGGMRFIDLLT